VWEDNFTFLTIYNYFQWSVLVLQLTCLIKLIYNKTNFEAFLFVNVGLEKKREWEKEKKSKKERGIDIEKNLKLVLPNL
jgi:hypothetical protein